MRYHFLKLGPGNSLAIDLLDRQVLGTPTAVGFFRKVGIGDIERNLESEKVRFSRQAISFYKWSHGMIDGVAVTVSNGRIWILEPASPMYEMDHDDFADTVAEPPNPNDWPKLVPVRVVAEERLTHVPTLLAQITANRSLSSSTFKEIRDDFGNQVALDHVMFKHGLLDTYPTIEEGSRGLYHLLLCLGQNELIALVARLLEESDLTVPAPTGGFVRDVDLFAYNDMPHNVTVGLPAFGQLVVPPRREFRHGAATIQIRGVAQNTKPELSPAVDWLVQLNAEPSARVFNHAWIGGALQHSRETRRWLERILRWVPFSGTVIRSLSG